MKKRSSRVFKILVTCLVSILYPFETEVVPPWKVQVVTEDGSPASEATVEQYWQHYSVEFESHQQELTTDSTGWVAFPQRRIRSCMLFRVVMPIVNVFRYGAHAGTGPKSFIIAYSSNRGKAHANYELGRPLPNQVRLKRVVSEDIPAQFR